MTFMGEGRAEMTFGGDGRAEMTYRGEGGTEMLWVQIGNNLGRRRLEDSHRRG